MEIKYKCDCVNVEVGSYDNQVILPRPEWSSKIKGICIDKCLANEITDLWKIGIITTGCCCGHNKLEPYIGVEPEFVSKMESMGYKHCDIESLEMPGYNFIPKSIKRLST